MIDVVSQTGRTKFAILFLLASLFLLYKYVLVMKLQKKMVVLKAMYHNTFLKMENTQKKRVKEVSMVNMSAIIILSYTVCSLLWAINELNMGFHWIRNHKSYSEVTLIIYSFNFYFPAVICIYLKSIQLKFRKGRKRVRVQRT